MRAVVVKEAGGDFDIELREIPTPGSDQALVRVHACGVCHSDMFAKEGGYPGVSYPLVPGHEISGAIEALGDDVKGWEVGQRVGVGCWLTPGHSVIQLVSASASVGSAATVATASGAAAAT